MAFDSTYGGVDANSYASVSEADDILDSSYGNEEWSLLDDEVKERLLVAASSDIDDIPLKYSSKSDEQSLNFPIYIDGSEDDGESRVKKACVLQAMYLFENYDAIKEGRSGAMLGVRQETLSSISKTVSGFNYMRRWHPSALKIMSPYSDFSVMIYRG